MHIGPDIGDAKITINAYDEKSITINEQAYFETLLILSDKIYPKWSEKPFVALHPDDFALIIQAKPQLLIIGTGQVQNFPSKDITTLFNQHKIGLEVMSTGAACRTYNVLVAEGRDVTGLFFI